MLSEVAVGDILCTCHVLAALAIAAYRHEKQVVTAHQTRHQFVRSLNRSDAVNCAH